MRARKDLEEFERKHQETISKMEHKFYEEKVRLQKETNQKMAEIQKLSHEVIVSQLKFTKNEYSDISNFMGSKFILLLFISAEGCAYAFLIIYQKNMHFTGSHSKTG